MNIVWRRQAERDLEHLFDFVLRHDPGAAHRLCNRIERRVAQLQDHPFMGRQGCVAGTRELVVAGTSYIVAYRIAASQIDVLAVIHAARRWPPTLDGRPPGWRARNQSQSRTDPSHESIVDPQTRSYDNSCAKRHP